jgi:DNA-binding transcriptional ArsR family regulator
MADRGIRFEMARGGEDSRTMIHLVMGFVQRIDNLRRKAHFGDMDQAIVAGMVAIGGIEHMMRVPAFRESFGDYRKVVGVEGQRGVNAHSIAEATGIPRETVRRKLKELVALGIVMEKERGRYIMTPGFVQRPENDAALQQVLGHFLQLMNDAVKLGIVKTIRS